MFPANHAHEAPRNCSALIVEDDTNERELLAGLLRMNGCECITVGDGQDALDYLSKGNRPDVILLDMEMRRCTGPEMLRRLPLRTTRHALPVVCRSAAPTRKTSRSDRSRRCRSVVPETPQPGPALGRNSKGMNSAASLN